MRQQQPGQDGHGQQTAQQQAAQQQAAQQQQSQQQVQIPPFQLRPMTREIFTTIYKNFMTKNPKDEQLLFYEGRNINLYQLHYEVISAGGVNRVIQNDLWPVIGARLGFVNIPASDTEPAKAGPAFAHRLASIYKEFLLDFDKQYYLSMLKKHMTSQKQLAENGLPMQQRNGMPSQPAAQNANPIRQLTDIQDSRLMNEIVSYSILPTEELQRRNVPPNIIQLVDQNRQQLQLSFERQRAFRAQVAKNTQGAQNGMGVPQLQRNPSVPMPGVPPTVGMPQQNGMGMMGQPGMQQAQGQQVNQGMQSAPGMPQDQHQQQQQQMGAPGIARMGNRPSPAQQQAALEMVARVKNECRGK
ncbi:hypothetical protein FKP32DRAFT_1566498, partial [Trametes sanguinea]